MFYVYLHTRVDTGEVFYIGKGRGRRAWRAVGRNNWWKHVVQKAGGFDAKVLASYENEDAAFEHERCAIACFRAAGVRLCNLTDGGEGQSGRAMSPETREKIASVHRGRALTASHKAALSAANKGRVRSAAHRANLSKALLGRVFSPDHRAKISAARKRQRRTEHAPD